MAPLNEVARVGRLPTIKLVTIVKSWKPDKKYVAFFEVNKWARQVHFGSATSQTYVEGADDLKKANYLKRHAVRENWNDPTSAGSLSRWILWEHRDINDAIEHFKTKFNL
jgi:hypothetical protein